MITANQQCRPRTTPDVLHTTKHRNRVALQTLDLVTTSLCLQTARRKQDMGMTKQYWPAHTRDPDCEGLQLPPHIVC